MFRILAITATLFGIMSAAHADVWRFTDPQGQLQYSDKWVPGSVLIKTDKNHPTPGAPGPAQDRLATSSSSPDATVAEQQAAQTVKQDVAKTKQQQCKEATTNYDKAIQSRRIYKEGKNGQREYISDAEADAYRVQLLEARKDACGK
jgi:hypothetical protein